MKLIRSVIVSTLGKGASQNVHSPRKKGADEERDNDLQCVQGRGQRIPCWPTWSREIVLLPPVHVPRMQGLLKLMRYATTERVHMDCRRV